MCVFFFVALVDSLLQMERETRMRQQENNVVPQQQQPQPQAQQPEFALRRNPLVAGANNPASSELNSSTVDPFLSSATAAASGPSNGGTAISAAAPAAPPSSLVTDFHARQESADSGLGMGGSYSLPHTPEDFLASMDDTMDTTLDCNGCLFNREPLNGN